MNLAALATVVPSLELFGLQGRATTIRANHNGVRIGGDGFPLPAGDEMFLARWGGFATLAALVNDDGYGPRGGPDGSYHLVEVAAGRLALAVCDGRLVGSFIGGSSLLGPVSVPRRRVLTFSWPYDDVESVAFTRERRGRIDVTGALISCVDMAAGLIFASATALNESWTSAWLPKGDLEGLARSVAVAAARHRKAAGDGAQRLEDVIAGRWTREGKETVAWLIDPETGAGIRRLDEARRRERAATLLLEV
jgi:hypothetical protein